MLFFRSGEALTDWRLEHQTERGPSCDLKQLWGLSVAWDCNRRQADSRRPQPEEIRAILADLNLSDPQWNPLEDRF